jgi:hypothetical protein
VATAALNGRMLGGGKLVRTGHVMPAASAR